MAETQCRILGEALLWAIASAFGHRFDVAARAAWVAAYEGLSSTTIASAGPAPGDGGA